MRRPQSGAHVAGASLVAPRAAAVSERSPAHSMRRDPPAFRKAALRQHTQGAAPRSWTQSSKRPRERSNKERCNSAPDSTSVRRLVMEGIQASHSEGRRSSGSRVSGACQASLVSAGSSSQRARGAHCLAEDSGVSTPAYICLWADASSEPGSALVRLSSRNLVKRRHMHESPGKASDALLSGVAKHTRPSSQVSGLSPSESKICKARKRGC